MQNLLPAYPSFRNSKRLGVLLPPPGWDASPLQGYPPTFFEVLPNHRRYPFILILGVNTREAL